MKGFTSNSVQPSRMSPEWKEGRPTSLPKLFTDFKHQPRTEVGTGLEWQQRDGPEPLITPPSNHFLLTANANIVLSFSCEEIQRWMRHDPPPSRSIQSAEGSRKLMTSSPISLANYQAPPDWETAWFAPSSKNSQPKDSDRKHTKHVVKTGPLTT